MRPSIYFNQQPCDEAKEILLEFFEDVSLKKELKSFICSDNDMKAHVNFDKLDVVWTNLGSVTTDVVVATPCTGTDHVKAKTIIHLDDEFKETVGRTVTSTAEHTLSLMLQLAKRARIQLSGKVLGIIGYGRIGSMVADFCHGLGMKILTYDIKGHGNATLDDVLEHSDVISLHIPLEENYRFIDKEKLNKMKTNGLIINTSRRNVVNFIDIVSFMNNEQIYYADDFYELDSIYSPRFSSTAHIAGDSKEAREITDIWLAEKLIRYWRSKNS